MKHIFILFAIIFLGTLSARANDGIYFASGNQLVPLQESDIEVRKEILTISLKDDGFADVDVYYEFFNHGKEKRVLMGFEADPPYNANEKFSKDGKHPDIFDFKINMNGNDLTYSNAVVNNTMNGDNSYTSLDLSKWKHATEDKKIEEKILAREDVPSDEGILYNPESDLIVNFSYSYYFTADFIPNVNIVKHHYRYRMSCNVGYLYGLYYKLSPATRWANHRIDDFTLIIRADNTAKYFIINKNAFANGDFKVIEGMGKIKQSVKRYDDNYTVISLRNGAVMWHSLNYVPDSELSITSADLLIDYESSKFSLGDFYDRSEGYPAPMFRENNKFNALQKRVIRNLPFANRGYVFHDSKLKKYFESQWWYMPDELYKASMDDFSKNEIEFMQRK